ncbi:MAG TPA: tetratricopeptide repeat protein [Thermoanaerobaculia bacterium]|nr:tetratricopeptide repeat protein [Thermoanaerobaculia bacterium]
MKRAFILVLCASILAPAAALVAQDSAPYDFTVAKMEAESGEVGAALKAFAELVKQVPDDPYVRIEYARVLLQAGNLKQAVSQASAATKLAPSNADALSLRAHALLVSASQGSGSWESAHRAYTDLLAVDPDNLQGLFSLAQIDLGQGRFDEAARELKHAVSLQPGNQRLQEMLVDACSRMTDSGAAQSILQELLVTDPGLMPARLALADLLSSAGSHEQALAVLSAAKGKDRDDPELLGRLAVEQFQLGQLNEALSTVDEALKAEPENSGDRFLKAMVLSSLGREEEAESLLRALASEGPMNADVSINLARVLEREGKAEQAVQVLRELEEKALRAGQKSAARRARVSLALLYSQRGEWQSAADALASDFASASAAKGAAPPAIGELLLYSESLFRSGHSQEALSLLASRQPPDDRVIAARAEMLLKLGRRDEGLKALQPLIDSEDSSRQVVAAQSLVDAKDYEEAVKLARRILVKSPSNASALFVLGASLERRGDRSQAESTFQDLLKLKPDFAPALNYLGYMWAERGQNLERALTLTQRAVALDPTNGAYVDSLGWANFKLGNYDAAKKYLERAVALTADDATVLEHLGDLYLRLGDRERARELYERSAAKAGDNLREVKKKLQSLSPH